MELSSLEKYIQLLEKLSEASSEEEKDSLLDQMDDLWHSLTSEEKVSVDIFIKSQLSC